MALSYDEKLRDPRWRALSERIRERDRRICFLCLSSAGQLEVHHLYYVPNTDPWDYPENALITLCRDCHYEVGRRDDWNEALRAFLEAHSPLDDDAFRAQVEHSRKALAAMVDHYADKPGSFWSGDDEEEAP